MSESKIFRPKHLVFLFKYQCLFVCLLPHLASLFARPVALQRCPFLLLAGLQRRLQKQDRSQTFCSFLPWEEVARNQKTETKTEGQVVNYDGGLDDISGTKTETLKAFIL